jgi:hypothetical protein
MQKRDERMLTIQAEIDQCMHEMRFLGSGEMRTNKTRNAILDDVIREMNAMKAREPILLLTLIWSRSLINGLLNEIKQMDFANETHWHALQGKLNTFHTALMWMEKTPITHLDALFTAVIKGIADNNPSSDEWVKISNREAHFKRILTSIGSALDHYYASYSRALPDTISMHVRRISRVLREA